MHNVIIRWRRHDNHSLEYSNLNFMHAEVYNNSLISRCIMKAKETIIDVPCEILDKEVMTFTNCWNPKGNYL